MDADTVLSDLARRGVVLIPEGENLRAQGALTDTDRATIRQHKPALLAALRRRPVTLPPSIEGIPLDTIRQWAGEDWPGLAGNPDLLDAFVQAGIKAGDLVPPRPDGWEQAVRPACLVEPAGGYVPPFVNPCEQDREGEL